MKTGHRTTMRFDNKMTIVGTINIIVSYRIRDNRRNTMKSMTHFLWQ